MIQTEIYEAAKYDLNPAVTADVDGAVAGVTNRVLRLVGYSVRESAGSPAVATLRIVHGATVSGGDAVVLIELAANGSENQWFGESGIAMPNGISIDHITGTFDCTLFYKVTL